MYRDASRVVEKLLEQKDNRGKKGGKTLGLKSLALAEAVKNKSKTYAVVCETLKYKEAIDNVLKIAKVQKNELAKNTGLMYVMLYDHLFGQGIKGGGAVKRLILSHDEKLKKALAQVMKSKGVDDHSELLADAIRKAPVFPRFARVNLIKTTVEKILTELEDDTDSKLPKPEINKTIPYVLKFPPSTDLHDHALVKSGELILQDFSSCFPAHILRDAIGDAAQSADAIDATAAPGNKTSQLASLGFRKVFAFDKDKDRHKLLRDRMKQAGALDTKVETTCGDFLQLDPLDPKFENVRVILLDPSCSGSGMLGRVDHLLQENSGDKTEDGDDRLVRLSKFQKECVMHAMKFPNVSYITYSTCSVHEVEDEAVVAHALENNKDSFQLVKALPDWTRRGRSVNGLSKKQAKCLVRVDPKEDKTCGFFVALFGRISLVNSPPQAAEKTSAELEASLEKKRAAKRAKKKRARERKREATKAENEADAEGADAANSEEEEDGKESESESAEPSAKRRKSSI